MAILSSSMGDWSFPSIIPQVSVGIPIEVPTETINNSLDNQGGDMGESIRREAIYIKETFKLSDDCIKKILSADEDSSHSHNAWDGYVRSKSKGEIEEWMIREFRDNNYSRVKSCYLAYCRVNNIQRGAPVKKAKKKVFNKKYLDKVVLPKSHKESIMEALTQEHQDKRKILFEDWGFDEAFEKGKGIVFMFYGVPGTGKTMCAEMIAKYLGVDHFVMSTADIQSSVPGQAERNIQEMFAKAKKEQKLIVIDECDSLLYNRNSVGAIMAAEINCLLSEIEQFEGVCILTTNRNLKLDSALERRIALKLEFPKPNKNSRKAIWQALIPKKLPLEKDVCYDKLSEYELCGGNIKNIIFAAARKALYSNRKKVRMDDFENAIGIEVKGKKAFERNSRQVSEETDGVATVRSNNLINKKRFV